MTDETKHTSGPWRVSRGNGFNSDLYVMAGNAAEICEVFDDSEEMALPAEANAHLLAASPDMLGALKMADETFRDLGWHDKYEITSAAIAKAEGRSK